MFIVFEGGEGSGKTTASKLLKSRIENELKKKVVLTREPGGTKVAEDIRSIILDNDIDPQTEVLLFAASRKEHVQKVIKPAIENNKVVICDRFVIHLLYIRDMHAIWEWMMLR